MAGVLHGRSQEVRFLWPLPGPGNWSPTVASVGRDLVLCSETPNFTCFSLGLCMPTTVIEDCGHQMALGGCHEM